MKNIAAIIINPSKTKINRRLFKDSFRKAEQPHIHYISVIKSYQLMLYKDIVTRCSKNLTNISIHSMGIFNVQPCGTRSCH
jgi:hypothetical protein